MCSSWEQKCPDVQMLDSTSLNISSNAFNGSRYGEHTHLNSLQSLYISLKASEFLPAALFSEGLLALSSASASVFCCFICRRKRFLHSVVIWLKHSVFFWGGGGSGVRALLRCTLTVLILTPFCVFLSISDVCVHEQRRWNGEVSQFSSSWLCFLFCMLCWDLLSATRILDQLMTLITGCMELNLLL